MGETLDKTQDNIIAQETKRAAEAGVITSEQATKDGIAAIEKALASGKNVPQNELIKLEEQANKQMKAKREIDLSTPADFTPPEELYKELISRILTYHPSADITMIEKAYKVADAAHKGQLRKSGEPYIMHPLNVAIILAELELDKETIVAGILHDVVEDTVMTSEEIAAEFSEEVAFLVDGVTKLTQLKMTTDKIEVQAENLRKMFLSMAKDIRVILIKLADRLHNLRTLQYQSPEKQIEKARETMDIYAPIAHRLGISKIKVELDDLSMMYLMPDVYKDLKAQIDEKLTERDAYIKRVVADVKKHIDNAGLEAEIDGRVKHFFSIYKKMKNQNKTLDQIYDIFAVRIKVNTVRDCYSALGIIHEMYKPIPGRFKDYIAMPKSNMYQSLHTTLIGPEGQPFEIQIRTYEMHRTAEYGIAAHWKYKENITGTVMQKEEEKLSWLRQILEWQRDTDDNKEFMSFVKTDLDLFAEQVYCFTPAGDVKNLPSGSTPIDFAYAIHTAVGNKMVGARVNGKLVPIPQNIREVQGKKINEYRFQVQRGDALILMSDGTVHAGVGQLLNFGWLWEDIAKYAVKQYALTISAMRLAAAICQACDELYQYRPGDDTTVACMRIINAKPVHLMTGPAQDPSMDEEMVRSFMSGDDSTKRIVCGGTSATIVSRILKKRLDVSMDHVDPDIPPIAYMDGIELVTEGVLTLNRVVQLLRRYVKNETVSEDFFLELDKPNGASMVAKMLIEDCTELHLYVGKAINSAYQNPGLPFDLGIRQNLVEQLKTVVEEMGKQVTVTYY